MLEELKNIICEYVEIDPESITESSDLRSDLGFNSLDAINLAVSLEEAFGVPVSNNDMAALYTVGDIIRFIESKK